MRRVVITGMGIVSCIGNNPEEVIGSLREGKSGIGPQPVYKELGFRSHVAGIPAINMDPLIDRKDRRFMGDAAAYSYVAMAQAIAQSSLGPEMVSNERTGLIVGSGGASSSNVVEGADTVRTKGVKRAGPYLVTRCMTSTTSACLATPFKIKGVNYSISSACATSLHCIGNAMELIQWGKQDIVFAGGGEEEHWSSAMMFDAMGALTAKYNDTPATASRPYDANRDGFAIAGGGGILVVEEREHALRRGAPILAELVGYGASSDGDNMVAPSGDGAARCMKQALSTVSDPIDYINTHGTSTPAGDITELKAIREVFGNAIPPISSTKGLSGHSLGAAGVHEVIYCLLMMQHDFIAASANIETLDPEAEGFPIVRTRRDNAGLKTVMSNSFGFGGTNATLVLRKA
ncbi:MAG TPA: beta-ketoacyl-ACP synthase I [Kiritimatiellia bacterium]|nr:beta-ketoacyl-ACP synthase I [Kiritimatiellia bacterium]HMO99441.1 beta-ketoacyl-ACP synthase I [Kiritimatiellia bacterium]